MRPPPFHRKAAVAKFVDEQIQEYWLEEERVFMTERMPNMPPYVRIRKPSVEQSAIFAAEQGDVTELTKLIAAGAPLAPAIRKLINEFLTHKRSLKTGKKVGGQKKSDEERRVINPVHDAAEEMWLISNILRQHWPAQTAAALHRRAIAIATERHRLSSEQLLRKHLSRAAGDRRRV
jgi:hypothetical protein